MTTKTPPLNLPLEDASAGIVSNTLSVVPRRKQASIPVIDRTVIAWDMEGITYVPNTPQSPVLFGSSASPPLIVPNEGDELSSSAMWAHIFNVADGHPQAIHVGYGFGSYDANMLLKDVPEHELRKIWGANKCTASDREFQYRIEWIPRKKIRFTRSPLNSPKTPSGKSYIHSQTVTIYDFASFFNKPFLDVCVELLRDELTPHEFALIEKGKNQRGDNQWSDMPQIIEYWTAEIDLLKRTFEKFRAVMVQAGFELPHWYGPGALASYILRTREMYPHLEGAQVSSGLMPREVHEASKRAFAGGRFEPFKFGFINEETSVADINSAYPSAITELPSLAEGTGEWVHVDKPDTIEHFGIYKIHYKMPNPKMHEYRPGPLFFRNPDGMVSYPPIVTGWYMSPEARYVQHLEGTEILEGWYWAEKDPTDRPWQFVQDLYNTRQRLGTKNLLSIPFKLGPNSLYGKLAQVAGWDRRLRTPPRSHALPIAAWITSRTREKIMEVMYQIDQEHLISVDTDSVTTTKMPDRIQIGDGLGEWGHDKYETFGLVQSGFYLAQKDGKWVTRTRGLDKDDVQPSRILSWVRSLEPGQRRWAPLQIRAKSRFVTLGAALRRGMRLWRVWEERIVDVAPSGEGGKRSHYAEYCPQCQAGINPADHAHWLAVSQREWVLAANIESQPRILPWEGRQPDSVSNLQAARIIELENGHAG